MLRQLKKISFLAIFLLSTLFAFSQRTVDQLKKDVSGIQVEMVTSEGEIVLFLYEDTPLHRDNFIKLVKEGFYKGLLFHRVIERFMVQAGDPESREALPGQMLGKGSLDYTIPAEITPGHFHKRGALCAARRGDDVNPKKESSSCQFYIVQGNVWPEGNLVRMAEKMGKKMTPEQFKAYTTVGGAPHLDGDYTVFGEVLKGMEVVDRIASLPRDRFDRPREDVRILEIRVL